MSDTASAAAAPTPSQPARLPPLEGAKLLIATVALGLGSFMNVLDTSIANVSLPTIAGDFAVSPTQGTWVITSYAVSEAIMLPLTGWLAGRFGEIRQFVIATMLFALASALCGLALSFPMLVISRVLQGVVGASMIPLSQTLIVKSFPPEKSGMALGIWSMTTIVAPIMGPIIGGWLTDSYSWRWVFYINIPFGIICALSVSNLLKGRESVRVQRPIDKVGLFLLTVGVGSLQILLDKGNELDWFSSTTIIAIGIISTLSLISFVIWELGEENPVVNLRLFKLLNFRIAAICIFCGAFAFYIFVVIGPLWMQTQLGYTAYTAGLVMSSTGVFAIFAGPFFGSQLAKLGARRVNTFGYCCFAIGCFMSSTITTDVDFHYLQLTRLIMGFGIAGFFVPLASISISQLKPFQMAAGSGLFNFLRNLGGSIGTAIGTTIWQNDAIRNHAILADFLTPDNIPLRQLQDQLTSAGVSAQAQLQYLDLMVNSQAYILSTNHLITMAGLIMLSMTAVVWFAKPPFGAGGGGH
jgi:DHA2 family multidrug resistance protein